MRRTVPCRCWRCNGRRTLSRHPSLYVRAPRCRACGTPSLYVCRDRLPDRWGRRLGCNCGGYHFKHRRGSKYCEFNPRFDVSWTERYDERDTRFGTFA